MSSKPPDKPSPGGGASLPDDYKAIFGRNLKAARDHLDMTQADLADRIGVSRAYVSHVELGTENLTFDAATRLAQAVGRKLPDMLERPSTQTLPLK